ncbi:hypothetical protein BKD30_05850 [Tersicoccus phoenicis]|uniref:Lycopene cyclase domain-containing protein n=1 Tax=Tersicoccus phoenicis TaxID=554083 RepID=A0A1R1LD14_9MICC|nr:lycopene cyclase domain-containing protein [Tersicoccus phoenicis]OMH25422.1 hypothetical protein BKD30_05850 [Tersicoccus phoenicis]
MTYTVLNLAFLVVAGVFALVAHRIAGRRTDDAPAGRSRAARRPWIRRHPRLSAAFATLVILLVLATGFDSIIVGVGLVAYDPARISGLYAGLAPVEDLAYVVGAVLVLPAVWRLLGSRRDRRRQPGREPGRR